MPVVVADLSGAGSIGPEQLRAIGYTYDGISDKWNIGDAAADYLYTGKTRVGFALPGTLKVICDAGFRPREQGAGEEKYFPLFQGAEYLGSAERSATLNFIALDVSSEGAAGLLRETREDPTVVLCLWSSHSSPHACPEGGSSWRK